MGLRRAEQRVEIAASPHACFLVITDYETFPAWQKAVKRTEVISRDEQGRGLRVRQYIDALLREITYTLDYRYDEPSRIEWDFVEGDLKAIQGELLLEPCEPDPESESGLPVHTEAIYRVAIDPGIPLPRILARRLNQELMKRAVHDLRDEAERRVAAGEI